jgi:hypothetical protein
MCGSNLKEYGCYPGGIVCLVGRLVAPLTIRKAAGFLALSRKSGVAGRLWDEGHDRYSSATQGRIKGESYNILRLRSTPCIVEVEGGMDGRTSTPPNGRESALPSDRCISIVAALSQQT